MHMARTAEFPSLPPGERHFGLRRAQPWAVVAVSLLLLQACGKSAPPSAPPAQPPSVVAVKAEAKPVAESNEFVGRVVASERVELRARVQGFLKERRFQEGQNVKAGDLLFLIEPDQYQSVVEQREADLAKAIADDANAQAQYKRGEELLKSNNIAVAKVDELKAAALVAKAGIAQAKAAVNAAKLDLGYTEIKSPIAGRIGLAKFTTGNLVNEGSGNLATVVKQDPIYVQFPVSQRQLLTHRQRVAEKGGDPSQMVAHAKLADGSLYPQPGKINFLDVTTDQSTDTVTVRAEFPNPDGMLVDGQYTNLVLEADNKETAIVIPQSALQLDQQGTYVLVIDGEHKAQIRRILTGQVKGGEVIVKSGLQDGDLVITQGIQKVRPGTPVNAAPSQKPQGSAAP